MQLLATTWSFSQNLGAPLLSGYPSLGSLLFLTKPELFTERLNYQQVLTQNRQDCVITTYSFIGVGQGLQSNL